MLWLADGENVLKISLLVSTGCTNVTDRQTDGWTDRRTPCDRQSCIYITDLSVWRRSWHCWRSAPARWLLDIDRRRRPLHVHGVHAGNCETLYWQHQTTQTTLSLSAAATTRPRCLSQQPLQLDFITSNSLVDEIEGLDTCYSAVYMSQTRGQQRFTISEVAADLHEPMVPQRIMWSSIARANGQLDPRCI